MKKILIALALVLVFGGLVSTCGYINLQNNIITLDESVSAQWGQVENVYQRRADLIPNLVNTVKGYADFEQETLTQVIEARAKATSTTISADNLSPEGIQRFQQAQDGLGSALSRLMVVAERYPDLKANQNFLELQAQLEGTENRIAVERKRYNDTVRAYNTKVRTFPGSLLGFETKGYFEAAEGADKVPEVKF
jgi:LemA protein